MTDWYAPNQQAVGTEPAAGTARPTKTKDEPEPAKTSKSKGKDD
jgi:hypothetical protein